MNTDKGWDLMGTVTVRAHQAYAGIKAGAIGEIESDDAVKAAIEAGILEKLTKSEAKAAAAEEAGDRK